MKEQRMYQVLLILLLIVGSLVEAQTPLAPLNLRISNEPPVSNSNFPAPNSWSAIDEKSVTGDIIQIDVQNVPSTNGHIVEHFEIGIQTPSGVLIERVLGGPATNYHRRHRGVIGANKVWLRAIYQDENDSNVRTPSDWSQPIELTTTIGSPRVTLTASKLDLIQGEGAYLEATVEGANTLRPLHDLHYRWYVSKADEQGSFDALPDHFATHFENTRTEGYGSSWAFVPRTTGETTIYCEVRDRTGVIATSSITLNTTSLTSAFSATESYFVSTSGDFTGAPDGARTFTSLDDALALIFAVNKRGVKGRAWLALRSGESFTASILPRFVSEELETFAITPFGSGARPVASFSPNLAMDTAIINGIEFRGFYDPSDPMNMPALGSSPIQVGEVKHSTVADSYFSGFSSAIYLAAVGSVSVIHNVEITNWGDYGVRQGDTGTVALVGSYIHQNSRTWRGGGKAETQPPFLADHGPFRTSRPNANRVISKVVAFTTNSWTSANFIQPTFRFFGSATTSKPLRLVCSEIISEGGTFTIGGNNSNNNAPSPQDIIIDKLIHITTSQPLNGLSTAFGGTTIKNFMVIIPNSATEASAGNGLRHILVTNNIAKVLGIKDNKNNPIIFTNGSVIDLRSGDNTHGRTFGAFANGKEQFSDVNVENILMYGPNIPFGVTDTLPLDLSPNWTPNYIGRFAWDEGVPNLSFANEPEATASFKPQPGSSAYKTATGNYIPVDDITGELRTSTTSKGAFH